MIKTLAFTLALATATTAAIASIPGRNGEVISMQQVSNAAAKADRLDASAKADRLPFTASLIVTGPVRIAATLTALFSPRTAARRSGRGNPPAAVSIA